MPPKGRVIQRLVSRVGTAVFVRAGGYIALGVVVTALLVFLAVGLLVQPPKLKPNQIVTVTATARSTATVTATVTATPSATAQPSPAPTVTRTQLVAVSGGGGDSAVFGGIAAVGAALAGIGTVLAVFAKVRVQVQLAQAETAERPGPVGPGQVRSYLQFDEQDQEHDSGQSSQSGQQPPT